MNQEKILGKIKWYKPEKGYGYIIGSDNEKYFFEKINCTNPNDIFKENELVLFTPNFIEMNYAENVEKVSLENIN